MLGKHETDPVKAFGIALRRQRKAAMLTQEQLAFDAGVQRNYISLIELGRNQPTVTVIFKLALALKTNPSTLIKMTEDELSRHA